MGNANMSYSNIGSGKGKSCINHIWIINGINHKHQTYKTKKELVSFNFFDYQQMFDSMVLSEILSDKHSVGVKDDYLVLIESVNTNIAISVNTPYGET